MSTLLPRVLIADDDERKRRRYTSLVLEPERPLRGITPLVASVADRGRAAELLREAWRSGYGFDLLVADLFFPSAEDGKAFLATIADGDLGFGPEELDVVVVSQQSDAEEHLTFLHAMQHRWSSAGDGAPGFDLELRGRDDAEWEEHERRFAGNVWGKIIGRLRKRALRESAPPAGDDADRGFLTTDQTLRRRIHVLSKYLAKRMPITLIGPPGVGKTRLARDLHTLSQRPAQFVSINLAKLTKELFASALFGHEKFAFTGANTQQKGELDKVGQGTLFFDEFDKIDSASQKALLEVMEERTYRRIGSDKDLRVEGAMVWALNLTREEANARVSRGEIDAAVASRIFSGETLTIPPLHARPADVALLIRTFWKDNRREPIENAAVDVLRDYLVSHRKDGRWLRQRIAALEIWVPTGQAASRAMVLEALPAEEEQVSELELLPGTDTFQQRVLHTAFSTALAVAGPYVEKPWEVFVSAVLERVGQWVPRHDDDFVTRSWREHRRICRICADRSELLGLDARRGRPAPAAAPVEQLREPKLRQ